MDGDETARLLRELFEQNRMLAAKVDAMSSARAPSGKTLRELYELDEAGWAAMSWAAGRRGCLKAGLVYFGDRLADSITRAEWKHWRDHVRAETITRRKSKPTPVTLNYEIQLWRGVYKRQILDGNCSTNPLEGLRKVMGAKRHRETEPTAEGIASVRALCSDRTWAFVMLASRRGFRATEARRLEWRQVDLERGRIMLYSWQEKTKRTHNLRITSDVVEALRAIRPEIPGRFVFPGRGGHAPLGAVALWRDVRKAFDEAGLEAAPGDVRVTFHDLRHAAASVAARKLPLPVAMRFMRHRSLSAAQRYIHVNDHDLDEAHEVMEREGNRKAPHSTQSPRLQEGERIILPGDSLSKPGA